MNLAQLIDKFKLNYQVMGIVDLDQWHREPLHNKIPWLKHTLRAYQCEQYESDQRLVFTLAQGDEYPDANSTQGRIAEFLAKITYELDLRNRFIVVLTNSQSVEDFVATYQQHSLDPVAITVSVFESSPIERRVVPQPPSNYGYGTVIPNNIDLDQLTDRERHLLTESETFCMYPWMHLHLYPDGRAKPCCMAEHREVEPLGNASTTTMREIWNSDAMKKLRLNMLAGKPSAECQRCYEKEKSGFFSGRRSANKHHGHHIKRVNETQQDGHLERFEMTHWDIRFSNLCNLRCRSCGHMFSSSWYQDQVTLVGDDYAKKNRPLISAGRHETDIWEQLLEHIDHVEQIYFAGGEPLIMDEHYRILDELERREMWHVRLIYNTNFTQVRLRNRYVFDYWRKFDSVAVGASLDAQGARAEYIRKGTVWSTVEDNRKRMLDTCPGVNFFISPTISILNALHVPDFHQDWVERGLLQHQDLNVNLLQDPHYLRADIAPAGLKAQIVTRIENHLAWLRPHDRLKRATDGFESLIRFIQATDNTHFIPEFWRKTNQLDLVRREQLLQSIPELQGLVLDVNSNQSNN